MFDNVVSNLVFATIIPALARKLGEDILGSCS